MSFAVDQGQRRCPVNLCGLDCRQHDLCCIACWRRLPETFQRSFRVLNKNQRALGQFAEQVVEMAEQALRRLNAELSGGLGAQGLGPLGEGERQEADTLTRTCTAFGSFAELLGTQPDYRPKLDCSYRLQKDRARLRENQRLADLYDREQAARGDWRRCIRMGIPGL